jgi:hypothetical protein
MGQSNLEKRGQRQLVDPPKVRTYKRPVTAYVHYDSMGGERLAFAITTSGSALGRLQAKADLTSNIVAHAVRDGLEHGARLIALPSQAQAVLDETRQQIIEQDRQQTAQAA